MNYYFKILGIILFIGGIVAGLVDSIISLIDSTHGATSNFGAWCAVVWIIGLLITAITIGIDKYYGDEE